MIKLGVAGSPISHSLSPIIHLAAYKELKIDAEFDAFEINENTFKDFYQDAKKKNFRGLALTMPLKEVCMDYLDLVEPVARQITSVNTIVFKSGGGNGFSTDLLAFKNLLSPYFGKEIAILGAGGTARAALGALKGTNTKVKILTRSSSRHSKMIEAASDTDIAFVDWNDFSSIQNSNLIISTTPKGSTDSFVVNESNADLFEVLYHPWPTKLVENYQRLGKQVIGGLSLLVEQALFQIQKFSEKDFDFDVMRTKLLKVAEQAANK